MGFYIMFDEAKRQKEGQARARKRAQDIANYKKGISAKEKPPPDPPYSDGSIPMKRGGLYRYKGLKGKAGYK